MDNMNALRISSIAFGMLCGITGVLAGVFLFYQGNEPVSSVKISYIGAEYQMWKHDTYSAYTLIPNYMLSGIIAVFVSASLLYWTVFQIHKKKTGSIVFLLLSIAQLLSGGGFVIDLAIITFLLSLGINKKLLRWKGSLGNKLGQFLAAMWFPSLIIYSMISIAVLFVTVYGMNSHIIMSIMPVLALIMFIPTLLLLFGSIAREIQKSK